MILFRELNISRRILNVLLSGIVVDDNIAIAGQVNRVPNDLGAEGEGTAVPIDGDWGGNRNNGTGQALLRISIDSQR